jgi:hypothetical protein
LIRQGLLGWRFAGRTRTGSNRKPGLRLINTRQLLTLLYRTCDGEVENTLAYYVGISLQNRQRFPNKAVGLASRRHVGGVAMRCWK